MKIENYIAYMTKEEYDALPQEMPEYNKGAMWLAPGIFTFKPDLTLHVLEGEESPCRAHGCNCYVGDLIQHVYKIEIV